MLMIVMAIVIAGLVLLLLVSVAKTLGDAVEGGAKGFDAWIASLTPLQGYIALGIAYVVLLVLMA